MTNSACLPRLTLLLAVALLPCVASGCASMNGSSEKWTAAWKKDKKPPVNDPNQEEVVSYWGQKKKAPKPVEMSPELKERLAKRTEERQTKSVADNLRDGNQRLKEGRLEESQRAFEQVLAAKADDADAHHGLAVIADKQQLFGVADNHYEAALRKQPRNANLLNDIGYSHWLRGGDKQAEKMLLEALAVDPGHKGATLNLGTLYGKQGRYEDAYALLRKGSNEAETQQYMAKLFPQDRRTRNGSSREQDLAMIQPAAGQRSALPMPADDRLDSGRVDTSRMTMEQMRAELDRRQSENPQQRSSAHAQNSPPRDGSGQRGAWNDGLAQDQRPTGGQQPMDDLRTVFAPNDPAWGKSGANNSYPGPGGHNTDSNGAPSLPGSSLLPYPGANPNGFVLQDQHQQSPGPGTVPAQDSLMAAPGTKPHSNIPFWPGAPVIRGNSTNNSVAPQSANNSSPWGQSAPGSFQKIEQTNYTDEGSRASHAAAQLGMNIGLGGMFSILPSGANSAGDNFTAPSSFAAPESRFGGEYSAPPQYQAPGSAPYQNGGSSSSNGSTFNDQNRGVQTVPFYSPHQSGSQNQGAIQLLGGNAPVQSGSSGNSRPLFDSSNRQVGASSGWNEATQQDSATNSVASSSESPANSIPRPWDAQSNFSSTAPLEVNGGRTSRYAKAPWDDPSIQPNTQPAGSRPFIGAWPNSGNGTGQAMQGGNGPVSNGSSAGGSPQQWPFSQGR